MTFDVLALITTGADTLLGLGFMLEPWGLGATNTALVTTSPLAIA